MVKYEKANHLVDMKNVNNRWECMMEFFNCEDFDCKYYKRCEREYQYLIDKGVVK